MDGTRVTLKLVPGVVGALEPTERCILEISDDFKTVSSDLLDPIFKTHNIVGIEFPDTITEIPVCLLEAINSIEYVKIGKGVTKIGASAFADCKKLKTLELPYYSALTEIGAYAFSGCVSLEAFTFPETLETISREAFNKCASLSTITFSGESSHINIGIGCFAYCSKLQTVIGADQVLLNLGIHAFYNCRRLKVDRSWNFKVPRMRMHNNGAFLNVPCPFPFTIKYNGQKYQVEDWSKSITEENKTFFETAVSQNPDLSNLIDPKTFNVNCNNVLKKFYNGIWSEEGFFIQDKHKRKAEDDLHLSFIDLGC